jgi:hypothetical protein
VGIAEQPERTDDAHQANRNALEHEAPPSAGSHRRRQSLAEFYLSRSQRRRELPDGLKAKTRPRGECPPERGSQRYWNPAVLRAGSWRCTSDEVVEHSGQAVDVTPLVGRLAGDPLWTGVLSRKPF